MEAGMLGIGHSARHLIARKTWEDVAAIMLADVPEPEQLCATIKGRIKSGGGTTCWSLALPRGQDAALQQVALVPDAR
jgi:hypothetical protein